MVIFQFFSLPLPPPFLSCLWADDLPTPWQPSKLAVPAGLPLMLLETGCPCAGQRAVGMAPSAGRNRWERGCPGRSRRFHFYTLPAAVAQKSAKSSSRSVSDPGLHSTGLAKVLCPLLWLTLFNCPRLWPEPCLLMTCGTGLDTRSWVKQWFRYQRESTEHLLPILQWAMLIPLEWAFLTFCWSFLLPTFIPCLYPPHIYKHIHTLPENQMITLFFKGKQEELSCFSCVMLL